MFLALQASVWIEDSYGHIGLMQAIRKQPMSVYGDGKQTRSFQYVSDLVRDDFSIWYHLI